MKIDKSESNLTVNTLIHIGVETKRGRIVNENVYVRVDHVPHEYVIPENTWAAYTVEDREYVEREVSKFVNGLKHKWWRLWLPEKYYEIYDNLDLDYNDKIVRVWYEVKK